MGLDDGVLSAVERWLAAGSAGAVARVVGVEGSGPRAPGAAMAVGADGEIVGAVSGGCVEGAIVELAHEVLRDGAARRATFGYSDDEAFAVGLTCGGTLHVFVEPIADARPWRARADAVRSGAAFAMVSVVEGPSIGSTMWCTPDLRRGGVGTVEGTLGTSELDRVVVRDLHGEVAAGRSRLRHYGPCGEAQLADVAVFFDVVAPPPKLWIFGAVDFTAALVRMGKVLGYRVLVADARAPFATSARFPLADEVIVDWPHRVIEARGAELGPRDAICVLTHDHKFDVPAIVAASRTDVGYLGAMGSRRTTDERRDRLRLAGLSDAELARLHAPIGLDVGARTPEETALSICAEIVANGTGRTAASLRVTSGSIHAAVESRA